MRGSIVFWGHACHTPYLSSRDVLKQNHETAQEDIMERTTDIARFIEFDSDKHLAIEHPGHYDYIRERLFNIISTYNPRVIVKAGLGEGRLLLDMAESFNAYIIVVDYSHTAMKNFQDRNKENPVLEKIKFITGNFSHFPIDYYAADLLVSIDYFNFIDTGSAIDEFRRALQFDGVLFLSMFMLAENDLDGIYDEFMNRVFQLHNDVYLAGDLKTFLTLNEFRYIKGDTHTIDIKLDQVIDYYCDFNTCNSEEVRAFFNDHTGEFEDLYAMKENTLSVPYFIGVFTREKPQ